MPASKTPAFALLLACACATPSLDTRLSSTEPARQHTVFRIDWRAQVASDRQLVAPLDIEQARWAPLESATPIVAQRTVGPHGEVVAAGSNGRLCAFSFNGKPLWHFDAGGGALSTPTAASGRIYVGSADGKFYAVSVDDGRVIWTYDTGEELGSTPVVNDGVVFVQSHQDTLFAIDADSGKWLWRYRREASAREFTLRNVPTPLSVKDLLVSGFTDGSVVALRRKNGTIVWQHISTSKEQLIDADGSPQTDGDRIFVSSYRDGLAALAVDDGKLLWQKNLPTATHIQLGRTTLFASAVGKVAAFSPYDGALLWEKGTGKINATGLTVFPGMVVVPTEAAMLFLDARSGRPLGRSFNPGRGVSAVPGLSGRDLYVLSNNGWLYAMRLL